MKSVEILEKQPICIAEVHAMLKPRPDEGKNYEQKLAWEHVSKFKKLSVKDAKKLIEELRALELRRLKEEFIIQVVDILPNSKEALEQLFASPRFNIHGDEIASIWNVVKNYV